MSVLNSLKTSETETAILLLVPDSFLPHITAQIDDLKAKWFAGEPPFDNDMKDIVTLTTAQQQGAPDLPLGANIVGMIQRSASVGAKMTDSQIRRMKELFGEARANFLFGPNWGEGAFKLAKYADPQTLTRVDGKWVQVNNTQFRRDMYDALMNYQLPANPMDIPIGDEPQPRPPIVAVQVPAPYPGPDTRNDHLLNQTVLPGVAVPQDVDYYNQAVAPTVPYPTPQVPQTGQYGAPSQQFVPPQYNVTPQQYAQQYTAPPQAYQQPTQTRLDPQMYPAKLEELIRNSHTGRQELSQPQVNLIEKTIKGSAFRIFTGRKDGSLQEFLRLCNKSRRKADKSGYENNPEFDQQFFDYVNRYCGN